MLVAMPNKSPLAVDEHGQFFDVVEGTTAFLLRYVTGGRPAILYHRGFPATVGTDASREDAINIVNRVGTVRLYSIDINGDEIPGAPVGILHITAEDLGGGADLQHWMRLDRVFDAFDRAMTAIESKDMLIAKTTMAIVESHTALQSGAVRMLDVSNQTITVANGVSRPDIDFDQLAEQIQRKVKEAQPPASPEKLPLSVQLLNGGFGQAALAMVCNWAGIPIPDIAGTNANDTDE